MIKKIPFFIKVGFFFLLLSIAFGILYKISGGGRIDEQTNVIQDNLGLPLSIFSFLISIISFLIALIQQIFYFLKKRY